MTLGLSSTRGTCDLHLKMPLPLRQAGDLASGTALDGPLQTRWWEYERFIHTAQRGN